MTRAIRSLLARFGLELFSVRGRYFEDGLFTLHSDHFRSDQRFRAAYDRGVQASHGVDPHFAWRVHVALWAAESALGAQGDFVECGVNAGFLSSAILTQLDWNHRGGRKYWLVDTFDGPVLNQFSDEEIRHGRRDLAARALSSGSYVTDVQRVRANFAEWPDAVVVQGAVPGVLADVAAPQVAFLHIDMNCVLPEMAALEFFWPKLTPGAIVLFDDYAYYGHSSQREAVDAFAGQHGVAVLNIPTGQGLILRTS